MRPETARGIEPVLVPGAALVLTDSTGPRACGKTQLAVFVAESLWRSAGVDLLVWITAMDRASVLAGYVAAAEAMGTGIAGTAESVASRFVAWLRETRRSWLVVLDDLRDPADLNGIWPEGPAGEVLITSPATVTHPGRQRTRVARVGALSLREAVHYLTGRITSNADQRHGAVDLVSGLGGEPLVLAQAGAVIASSAQSCTDYQARFGQRRRQFAAAQGDPPSALAVAWTLSSEWADLMTPGAQYLLVLGSLLDGHRAPAAIFTAPAVCAFLAAVGARGLADPKRAWEGVLSLERVGLLTVDRADPPGTVWMSSAVQAAIRPVIPGEMVASAVRAAADALVEIWPRDEPHAGVADGLRSCAVSVQRIAGDRLWKRGVHPLLLQVGHSLDTARLTGPAVAYWGELAALAGRALKPGDEHVLTIGDRLANAYLAAGRAPDAVAVSQRALAERMRSLGQAHPGTVAAGIDLGRALTAAGRPGDGITMLNGVVTDAERVLGAGDLETLRARDELADACRAAGRIADSVALYRRTLAEREGVQGPRHPDTAATRQKLAAAHLAEGRTKDAISLFKRAVADRERALGADHPDTIALRAALAAAHHSAGRMAPALRLSEQACADSGRVLGIDHPDSLRRCAGLAHIYYATGRLTDAITLLRETAALCDRALPPGDPITKAVRESLANIAGQ